LALAVAVITGTGANPEASLLRPLWSTCEWLGLLGEEGEVDEIQYDPKDYDIYCYLLDGTNICEPRSPDDMPFRPMNQIWVETRPATVLTRGYGFVALLLDRLINELRGDMRWAGSDTTKRVIIMNLRDRARFSTRPKARTDYEPHPGLSEADKVKAMEEVRRIKERETARKAHRAKPPDPARAAGPKGKKPGARQRVAEAWIKTISSWMSWSLGAWGGQRLMGLWGVGAFVGYKAFETVDGWEWVSWSYYRVKDGVEMTEEMKVRYEHFKHEVSEDGKYWYVPTVVSWMILILIFWKVVMPILGCFMDLLGRWSGDKSWANQFRSAVGRSPMHTPGNSQPGTPREDGTAVSDSDADLQEDPRFEIVMKEQDKISRQMTELIKEMQSGRSEDTGTTGTPRSTGVSSGSATPMSSVSEEQELNRKADLLLARLKEHQDVLADDQGTDKKILKDAPEKKKHKDKKKESGLVDDSDDEDAALKGVKDSDEDSESESDSEYAVTLEHLKREARNPRKVLLKRLEKVKKKVPWRLKHGFKTRVGPTMLAKYYSNGGNMVRGVQSWIQRKGLKGCPTAENMLPVARSCDKMVMDLDAPDDIINSELLELLLRQLYGTFKAFERVKGKTDWDRPAGDNKKSWVSKVNQTMLDEFNFLVEDDEEPTVPGVDKELSGRLKLRALLNKNLTSISEHDPNK